MRAIGIAAAATLVLALGATDVSAKGHLVGAAVGATLGAHSHHAVAGAVAGGAIVTPG